MLHFAYIKEGLCCAMEMMRYTIVDDEGAVSFVADSKACPAMVAACSDDPANLRQLLERADFYYRNLKEYVLSGLAVFDEKNAEGEYTDIHEALSKSPPQQQPVFRVVDDVTREASLRSVKAGAIIFNLRAKRIVQMDNEYRDVSRNGEVRIFDGSSHTNLTYNYRLPRNWKLVP